MRRIVALSIVGMLGALLPNTASAHFTIDKLDDNMPVSWMSQDKTGGPQKTGPCAGMPNASQMESAGTPTKIVTSLMPGETVQITVTATVPHPGWYRVALMEGAASSQSLTTIPDPMAMSGTNCTPAIMTNPVWSKTQPVIADGLPTGSVAKTMQMGTQTFSATIPMDANCTAAAPCTLQVIMVMTDHPANDCYYHHCADFKTDGTPTTDGGPNEGVDASAPTDASSGDARDAAMSAGGTTAAGGAKGQGGTVGTGGITASASGGRSGSGGSSASGGSSVTGGSGGAISTGGTSASGGMTATASGGKTASGGNVGSGGSSSGSGGTTGGNGSGGSSSSNAAGSSGGCNTVPGGPGTPLAAAGVLLLALLARRARRSR